MAKKQLRIRRGTKVHCIYEAAATHSGSFTAHEILAEVKKQFKAAKMDHVVNLFSTWAQYGFIKKTGKKKKAKGATRKSTAWVIDMKKPQPVIIELGQVKKSPQQKAWDTRRKKVLPPEVDALTLGEAVIDYISYLQSRVSELALDVRTSVDKAKTQEQALKREISQKQYEIDGLKKNNADLQSKLAQSQKRKGLKLDPIIEHHKRTRAAG